MSRLMDQIEVANRRYAEFSGEENKLPVPRSGRFSVLTCMDPRLDVAKFTDLRECAHVIRNAGGRATEDAIRSLVISHKLLDSRDWFVIHQTDCEEGVCQLSAKRSNPASLNKVYSSGAGGGTGFRKDKRNRLLTRAEQNAQVVADVRRIRRHPLVPQEVAIHGHIYDVGTGSLQEVFEATSIGGGPATG